MTSRRRAAAGLVALLLCVVASAGLAATEHQGQVTFAGVAVPGAAVIASQGDKQIATSTDADGFYKFGDLTDGVWTIKIEMRGFARPGSEKPPIGKPAGVKT